VVISDGSLAPGNSCPGTSLDGENEHSEQLETTHTPTKVGRGVNRPKVLKPKTCLYVFVTLLVLFSTVAFVWVFFLDGMARDSDDDTSPTLSTAPSHGVGNSIPNNPTSLPSFQPTTSDTTVVAVSMSISGSDLSDLSESVLGDSMVAILPGISSDMVKSVEFNGRRRLGGATIQGGASNVDGQLTAHNKLQQLHERTLATTVASVTIELRASLNALGFATADEFKSTTEHALASAASDGSLASALQGRCGSCRSQAGGAVLLVTGVTATTLREYPTLNPSPLPSSGPTTAPTLAFIPRTDPFLVAWWPLDQGFADASPGFHGHYNLTSQLVDYLTTDTSTSTDPALSAWPNATLPTTPREHGFLELEGYTSSGGCYGPTQGLVESALTGGIQPGLASLPAAASSSFSSTVDVALNGLTVTGWALGKNGGEGGVLFGWGTGAWNEPSLVLRNGYGFLLLTAGSAAESVVVKYNGRQLFSGCWHHLAVVVEPISGAAASSSSSSPSSSSSSSAQDERGVRLYVDHNETFDFTVLRMPAGASLTSSSSSSSASSEEGGGGGGRPPLSGSNAGPAIIHGSPFRINTNSDGKQMVDEVAVWARALTGREIKMVAEETSSAGWRRSNSSNNHYPRCPIDDVGDDNEGSSSSSSRCLSTVVVTEEEEEEERYDLHLRFLTASHLVVVTDPTTFLHDSVLKRCGAWLAETEQTYRTADPHAWQLNYAYRYAAMEVVDQLRPNILRRVSSANHFNISASTTTTTAAKISMGANFSMLAATATAVWPNAARELRVARAILEEEQATTTTTFDYANGGHEMTATAEVQFFSFIDLPSPLQQANDDNDDEEMEEEDYCFSPKRRAQQGSSSNSSGSDGGVRVTVRDSLINEAHALYDECSTVSFALKVDQAGFQGGGGVPKYGYFGGWKGAAGGGLDVSPWVGKPFFLRKYPGRANDAAVAAATAAAAAASNTTTNNINSSSSNSSSGSLAGVQVFQGVIAFRANDTVFNHNNGQSFPLLGETVLELNFTSYSPTPATDDSPTATTHHYRLMVPGVGVSWPFSIGQEALGEAFYLHARGLYHQRCGLNLTENFTAWPRGDAHQTYRGGHPPQDDDYKDHTAEGWGFRKRLSNGSYEFASVSWFDVVGWRAQRLAKESKQQEQEEEEERNYTTKEPFGAEPLPNVRGGWHDAGDFDRRDFHFGVVSDLVHAYLAKPHHFTDSQLNLPESGNGLPDLLDEAVWGCEVWRQAQLANQPSDGRVGTWIEATSHPHERDAGKDEQPYYLALATRQSSLHYAAHAALLARGLLRFADLSTDDLAGPTTTPPLNTTTTNASAGNTATIEAAALAAAASASSKALAATFVESARRAFSFGVRTDVRVGFDLFNADSFTPAEVVAASSSSSSAQNFVNVSWVEPEVPNFSYVLDAASQLWLATGDPQFFSLYLNTSNADAALRTLVANAHWQAPQATGLLTYALDVPVPSFSSSSTSNSSSSSGSGPALGSWPFPDWKVLCVSKFKELGDFWLDNQASNAYRKVWYKPQHGYFTLGAWGANGFRNVRWLTSAFVVTGHEKYRAGALLGVNWMQGANPQGRPYTTGLGSTPPQALLHLPSSISLDDPDLEVVPGLTLYGNTGANAYSAAQRVYGLFDSPRSDGYPGSSLAQLPPPWLNGSSPSTTLFPSSANGVEAGDLVVPNDLAAVRAVLEAHVPYWRRLQLLESQNVPVTEFTVAETVGHATAVTGILMGASDSSSSGGGGDAWQPSEALMHRKRRRRKDLLDGWIIQP
jgi:hypothetical protein